MNLASVNLNLLVAFDALFTERHVTRAAARVGVTQSAMSNSLKQLRALFGDDLFVRGPRGVTATARALELGPRVRAGLATLSSALGEEPFDPTRATRSFVLTASDFATLAVLPALLRTLARDAPGVRVDVRPWSRQLVPDSLARGDVDLAIGYFDRVPPRHRHRVLFEEPYACIVRKGHPAVNKKLTAKLWASIPHVVVSDGDAGPTGIDRALEARGLSRRVALRVAHFLLVPPIVASTDLGAAIDRRVALAFDLPLRVFEPPIPLRRGRVAMVWHERVDADPALTWFRSVVQKASAP